MASPYRLPGVEPPAEPPWPPRLPVALVWRSLRRGELLQGVLCLLSEHLWAERWCATSPYFAARFLGYKGPLPVEVRVCCLCKRAEYRAAGWPAGDRHLVG